MCMLSKLFVSILHTMKNKLNDALLEFFYLNNNILTIIKKNYFDF